MDYDVSIDDEFLFDDDEANKYVLFDIYDAKYAIHIKHISEIVSISAKDVVTVPGYPEFARGIIDLRGMTVSIIDFRVILGSGKTEITKKNYCIISDYNGSNYGILVDKVSDITNFGDEGIQAAPKAAESYVNKFIEGVSRADGKIVMVLDPKKVFDAEQVDKMND